MVKFLKCPKCGQGFKAPKMDLKFTGLGYSIPGLGVIKCPDCDYRDRRKRFIEISEEEMIQAQNESVSSSEPESKPKSESETLDESRFESG